MLASINNWPLARKMLVAFSTLALLVGGLALNGYVSNEVLTKVASRHVNRGVNGMGALAELMGDVKELRIIVYSYYNFKDAKDEDSLRERLTKATSKINKDLADYRGIAGDEFLGETDKLKSAVDSLNEVNAKTFEVRHQGDSAAALTLIKGDGKTYSRAAIDQVEKLLTMSRERSEHDNADGQADSRNALLLSILLSVLSFCGLAGVWALISGTVAKPMSELSKATAALAEGGTASVPHRDRADELGEIAKAVEQFRLAAVSRAETDARAAEAQKIVTTSLEVGLQALKRGDLTASIDAEFPQGYAELKTNFNEALGALRDLIGTVAESATSLRTGSGEIAQASEDLARRTEANAASLEETSAAVTQMDQRLRATAEAASRTVARADGAISTVAGGRSIADEAVGAMSRVADSAKGIDAVIEGLDKIAFQTRVLAMNAAVEAGRAGEAGRGFAVVADLVSALAMRAEEEAGRARDQLTATQTDIVAALDMVQKVDGALANISGDVSEVHALLGNMATDNQAQSTAITQISTAIGTMDHSTQQNAAMVEETSAAARNLSSEVNTLAEQAAKFNIGKVHGGSVRAVAAPRVTKPQGYVSPVKPLPVAAMASTGGDDWASF